MYVGIGVKKNYLRYQKKTISGIKKTIHRSKKNYSFVQAKHKQNAAHKGTTSRKTERRKERKKEIKKDRKKERRTERKKERKKEGKKERKKERNKERNIESNSQNEFGVVQ